MKVMLNTIKSYSAFGKIENKTKDNRSPIQTEEHNDAFIKNNKTNSRLSEADVNEFIEFYFEHDEDNREHIRMLLEDKAERYSDVLKRIDEIEAQEAERLAKRGTIKGLIEDIQTAFLELMMLPEDEIKAEEIYGMLEDLENNPAQNTAVEDKINTKKTGIFQKISGLFSK